MINSSFHDDFEDFSSFYCFIVNLHPTSYASLKLSVVVSSTSYFISTGYFVVENPPPYKQVGISNKTLSHD